MLPSAQAIEQAVQKKKRILLLRREMERARAGGGDGQGGFLRRLVNSVVRPGQSRTPAELVLSLQAEVMPLPRQRLACWFRSLSFRRRYD